MDLGALGEVPAAMFIESAVDMLKEADPRTMQDQRKELHVAVGDKSEDFIQGYELGLQTARVCVMLTPSRGTKEGQVNES